MARCCSVFSFSNWRTFFYLLLSLTLRHAVPGSWAVSGSFQVPSSISVYLTVQPEWNIQEGAAVNFSCTLSATISNSVLYLSSLTNSSLLNIVQVQYAYQKASISTLYSTRVSVYVLESTNTVLFGFSNMSTSDSGTYICYMKTVYSTPVDSNTVVVKVFGNTEPKGAASTSTPTTVEHLAVSNTNTSNNNNNSNLVLIIAAASGGAVGILVIVLCSVLIVRYRAKQRALKRRLQVFETSRQHSLEENVQVPTSPPCQHQHPSITGYSRQSSYDTSNSQSAEPRVFSPSSQRTPRDINSPSTNVVFDPPCVLSKALILQNVTSETSQYDNVMPSKRPVSSRMPRVSAAAASAPADLMSTVISQVSRSQSTLNHATSSPSVGAVDKRTLPSQTLPQITSISANPLSPYAANSAKQRHPMMSEGVLPGRNQRGASSRPPAKIYGSSDTSNANSAAKGMQRSENNFLPGTGTHNRDAPPSYNQVLLSNQAVALFGDALPIPRFSHSSNQSTSQTFPDEQFVRNEVYCPAFPEQPKSSRTS